MRKSHLEEKKVDLDEMMLNQFPDCYVFKKYIMFSHKQTKLDTNGMKTIESDKDHHDSDEEDINVTYLNKAKNIDKLFAHPPPQKYIEFEGMFIRGTVRIRSKEDPTSKFIRFAVLLADSNLDEEDQYYVQIVQENEHEFVKEGPIINLPRLTYKTTLRNTHMNNFYFYESDMISYVDYGHDEAEYLIILNLRTKKTMFIENMRKSII